MKKTNLNGQVLSEMEMKEVKGGFPNVKPLNESFGTKCPAGHLVPKDSFRGLTLGNPPLTSFISISDNTCPFKFVFFMIQ